MNFGSQLASVNSSAPKNMGDQPVRKMTVDEFMGDVTAGRINFEFNKSESDSFKGSEDQDSNPFSGDSLAGGVTGMETKTQAFGSEFSALIGKPELNTAMTSAQRAELTQKVMDSANYLVREGAGSVKLDLSTTDLGSLQIAINLSDNKVDIKVFTESDPVREAMIADLSRLKDALQTQNVNLNQVQVGVGERFPNSSSFDQSQQFNKHQEFRETFAENMKQSATRAARDLDLRNVTPPSMMNRMNQISADGRVQIRI
jgi:flagellar hook-length control protein FliK